VWADRMWCKMKPRDVEDVWKEQRPVLEAALAAFGEVNDISDVEYGLAVVLPNGAFLQVYLGEEKIREGEGEGLAWTSIAAFEGGEIYGQCTPGEGWYQHNYSSNLWTNDVDELSVRLKAICEAWRLACEEMK